MQGAFDPVSELYLFLELLLKSLASPEGGLSPFVLLLNFLLSLEEITDHVVEILDLVLGRGEGHHFFLYILQGTDIFLVLHQLSQQFAANQVKFLSQLFAFLVLYVLEQSKHRFVVGNLDVVRYDVGNLVGGDIPRYYSSAVVPN